MCMFSVTRVLLNVNFAEVMFYLFWHALFIAQFCFFSVSIITGIH